MGHIYEVLPDVSGKEKADEAMIYFFFSFLKRHHKIIRIF